MYLIEGKQISNGGNRVCSYLDPSEPKHAQVKQLLFDVLASRKSYFIPIFRSTYSALFDKIESELSSSKLSVDFSKLNDDYAFEFIGSAYFGSPPSNFPALGNSGPSKATKWLFLQLCPFLSVGLPKILEEIFLHTFPLPPCVAKSDYKVSYSYFTSAAEPNVHSDPTMLHGLSMSEACYNLLFATTFNSYGGIKVFFPSILRWVAQAGPKLPAQLAEEIHAVVMTDGGQVTLSGLEKMELTKSVLHEVLRMEPPVPFQYGKAKKDFIVESHGAAYQVKEGETLFGYQPIATKDDKVFCNPDQFVADRFMGKEGNALIKYVWWSNGPETDSPTLANKQCAGKDFCGAHREAVAGRVVHQVRHVHCGHQHRGFRGSDLGHLRHQGHNHARQLTSSTCELISLQLLPAARV